jgi:hypothetical protein
VQSGNLVQVSTVNMKPKLVQVREHVVKPWEGGYRRGCMGAVTCLDAGESSGGSTGFERSSLFPTNRVRLYPRSSESLMTFNKHTLLLSLTTPLALTHAVVRINALSLLIKHCRHPMSQGRPRSFHWPCPTSGLQCYEVSLLASVRA